MKLKKSKIIPNEIISDFTNRKFSDNYPNKASYYNKIRRELNKYSQSEFIRTNHPEIFLYFQGKGISHDMLFRALNYKKNKSGATPQFRNLLTLYSTDGNYTWNQFIAEKYNHYSNLLDDQRIVIKEIISKNYSNRFIKKTIQKKVFEEYEPILSNASPSEREMMIKQILEEPISKKFEKISDLITISNEKDPKFPVFPPKPFYKPEWPATPTFKINVPGFRDVWLKDESKNPTGTHKDRMGWEVAKVCAKYEIREISLISSGSAAIAVHHFLKTFEVNTKLNVLVDKRINQEIKTKLEKAGCFIHVTDLKTQKLNDRLIKIKSMTDLKEGIDITYKETMDIDSIKYYDWMSYEIINQNPDFCIVPFGTGDLYTNILNILFKEYNNRNYEHDKRFEGNLNILKKCSFLGARTNNPQTKLDKLFAYHLPSFKKNLRYMKDLKRMKIIGQLSEILFIDESYIEPAIKIAMENQFDFEPSGIAGLALLLQLKNVIPSSKKILIINTGKTNYTPEI